MYAKTLQRLTFYNKSNHCAHTGFSMTLRSLLRFTFAATMLGSAMCPTAYAQAVWLSHQIKSPDATNLSGFGFSVGLSDNHAVIGAPYASTSGVYEGGAAYVFAYQNGNWSQQAAIAPPSRPGEGKFGYSVAISGNTLAIGVPNPYGQGRVYVYQCANAVWSEVALLKASDGTMGDQFGLTVAIAGNQVIVGDPLASVVGISGYGKVYVFDGNQNWSQTQTLISSGNTNSNFGAALSVSGDLLAVGEPGATDSGETDAGAVYMYSLSNGTWNESTNVITPDHVDAGDEFGFSVSLDNTNLIIGAPGTDTAGTTDQGAAYLYEESAGTWQQNTKFVQTDAPQDASLGSEVMISNDTAWVNQPNDLGTNGVVNRYSDDNGTWEKGATITDPDNTDPADFGFSLAVDSSGQLAIGNIHGDTVYLYNKRDMSLVIDAPRSTVPNGSPDIRLIATNNDTNTAYNIQLAVTQNPNNAVMVQTAGLTGGTCNITNMETEAVCSISSIPANGGEATMTVGLKADTAASTIDLKGAITTAAPELTTSTSIKVATSGSGTSGGGSSGLIGLGILTTLLMGRVWLPRKRCPPIT